MTSEAWDQCSDDSSKDFTEMVTTKYCPESISVLSFAGSLTCTFQSLRVLRLARNFRLGQPAYDMSGVDFMLVGPRLLILLWSFRQQSTAERKRLILEEVAAPPNDAQRPPVPRFRKTPTGETVEAHDWHVTAPGIGLAMMADSVIFRRTGRCGSVWNSCRIHIERKPDSQLY